MLLVGPAWRLVLVAAPAAALGCTTLLGSNKDYREQPTGATAGAPTTGGASGVAAMGGAGGVAGMGGVGGMSGMAGMAGMGGTGSGQAGATGGSGAAPGGSGGGSGAGGEPAGAAGSGGATGGQGGAAGSGGAAGAPAGSAGTAGSGGSPPIAVPRPLAPVSTSTVTSQTPTFRWVLPAGSDGAHVELCADRACKSLIGSFDASGDHGAPGAPLKPGVVFWRLTGTSGGANPTAPSPVWQFTVGYRSAPVDTSWGATLDVNGDGFADVVIGAYQEDATPGHVYAYMGSAAGVEAAPTTTLMAPDADPAFGITVARAGDVDGDGFADVLVGAIGSNRAYLYLGGPNGLSSSPAVTLTGPDAASGFGTVAGAGDVNGDGFADVLVGAFGIAQAYMYLGGPSGPSVSPAATLTGPLNTHFGSALAGAGDVNGDGFADVVVGAWNVDASAGQAFVYLGGKSGLAVSPASMFSGSDGNTSFGTSVACAGDVNGDGFADLVIGANSANDSGGEAYVYLGGKSGFPASPVVTLLGPDTSNFGGATASAGDVNGDGFADLVVGASYPGITDGGRAYVYLGGASGPSQEASATLTGPDGGQFGTDVAGAGDVNGDGLADLIIGASGVNKAYVYTWSASGPPSSPSALLSKPGSSYFGSAVASAGEVLLTPRYARRAADRRIHWLL